MALILGEEIAENADGRRDRDAPKFATISAGLVGTAQSLDSPYGILRQLFRVHRDSLLLSLVFRRTEALFKETAMRIRLVGNSTSVRVASSLSAVALAIVMAFGAGRIVAQEPAKARPTGELKHANAKGSIVSIQYCGKYLMAADRGWATVHLWDLETGNRVRTIDAGYCHSNYPDFVATSNDKRMFLTFRDGFTPHSEIPDAHTKTGPSDIRLWDLETGMLVKKFLPKVKDAEICFVTMSPDGESFLSIESTRHEVTGATYHTPTIWRVRSGDSIRLPSHPYLPWIGGAAAFSPDGKSICIRVRGEKSPMEYETFLNVHDAATGKLNFSLRTNTEGDFDDFVFSPNGEHIVGVGRSRKAQISRLKVWTVDNGAEVNAIMSKDRIYDSNSLAISPDGRTVAIPAYAYVEEKIKDCSLVLFKLEKGELIETAALKFDGSMSTPIFNSSGTLAAVISRKEISREDKVADPKNSHPSILHIIDLQAKSIQTSAELPPDVSWSLCFSPEGQQIAVGSLGRVLLFDLSLGIERGKVQAK